MKLLRFVSGHPSEASCSHRSRLPESVTDSWCSAGIRGAGATPKCTLCAMYRIRGRKASLVHFSLCALLLLLSSVTLKCCPCHATLPWNQLITHCILHKLSSINLFFFLFMWLSISGQVRFRVLPNVLGIIFKPETLPPPHTKVVC